MLGFRYLAILDASTSCDDGPWVAEVGLDGERFENARVLPATAVKTPEILGDDSWCFETPMGELTVQYGDVDQLYEIDPDADGDPFERVTDPNNSGQLR